MQASDITQGMNVRIPRSNRKWRVISVSGAIIRIANGSDFETRRKIVNASDCQPWHKPTNEGEENMSDATYYLCETCGAPTGIGEDCMHDTGSPAVQDRVAAQEYLASVIEPLTVGKVGNYAPSLDETAAVVTWCREWVADTFGDGIEHRLSSLEMLSRCNNRIDGGLAFVLADVRRVATDPSTLMQESSMQMIDAAIGDDLSSEGV